MKLSSPSNQQAAKSGPRAVAKSRSTILGGVKLGHRPSLKAPSRSSRTRLPNPAESNDEPVPVRIEVPREKLVREAPDVSSAPASIRMGRDGDLSLRLYLREISETPLLTPQDEVELAGRIQAGDDEAREQMIKANLRLVVKIAHDYEGLGLPLLDMINEGNMGLMRAVQRFDPTKGAKLSTYAAWWIKQSIKRSLANQSKTIRVPVHLVDRIARIKRVSMELQEEYGREPSGEEIAEAMGMTPKRVGELLRASQRPISLDAPVGDDDDMLFAERVKDEQVSTAYEELARDHSHSMLREFLTRLEVRERTILSYRFGLDGGTERTLEEVGQHFGVTRERIRQIQNVSLAKLRRWIERREAVCDPDLDTIPVAG
jgi:RNA polymerase primary sigma factor